MEAAILRWMLAVIITFILFSTGSVLAKLKSFEEIRADVLNQCQGRFKNKHLTEEELKNVLTEHKVWFETYAGEFDTQQAELDPRKANLCGADLSGFDLRSIDLFKANLSGANLSGANLSDANLIWANLSGANLKEADLSVAHLNGVDLGYANLSGANLSDANLRHTRLVGANLSMADLSGANLVSANLSIADLSMAKLSHANLVSAHLPGADLSGAIFSRANLGYVHFEPMELPHSGGIASASNLYQMSYFTNPQALTKLRQVFKEGGYYQQEREITCAIQRSKTVEIRSKGKFLSFFEATFRYIFFDLTCQWGMVPGRALLILLALIPVFAIPYVVALRLPSQDGIWIKWADDRVRVDLGTKKPTRRNLRWRQAPALALYFSVLSAFNIGWRELNVGNWIQRIQAKEYTLKATGWVRTVAGVQSLISAYLIAIWALTYFGRPFE